MEAKIQQWKQEFKHVYKTTIDGQDIIWRRLKRSEYSDIMAKTLADDIRNANFTEEEKTKSLYKRQEMVVLATALYPENIQELVEDSAGVASVLADEIMTKSGFDEARSVEL